MRQKTDGMTGKLLGFYVTAYIIVVALGLIWWFGLSREAELPARVGSYCIDGILVVADGNVIGCVNGAQSANQMWTPEK